MNKQHKQQAHTKSKTKKLFIYQGSADLASFTLPCNPS